ncbi:MAG: F0F1 ATP synthase subunit epsilon [Pirellulales bacterium]|nr:F0F1 ATP synthase subunit epsilon [Pirellulales bacterium]
MSEMRCIVVTPEETLRDTPAEFVALPLYDGEIGVAPGHGPMIGRLGAGELRITAGDRVWRYYVEGGFVEVLGDVVSVLAGQAVPAEALDEAVVLEELDTARSRKATTPDLMAQRDRAVAQYRAQARVARRARAEA